MKEVANLYLGNIKERRSCALLYPVWIWFSHTRTASWKQVAVLIRITESLLTWEWPVWEGEPEEAQIAGSNSHLLPHNQVKSNTQSANEEIIPVCLCWHTVQPDPQGAVKPSLYAVICNENVSSKTSHLHMSWNSCTKRTEVSLNMKKERRTSGPWRDPFCLEQGTEQPHRSVCHYYLAMPHFYFAYFMEGSSLGPFILNWIILTSTVW